MAMTAEQKRRMRAAFDELDLMSASRSDEGFKEKEKVGVLTEQDQKREVENQPPKQSLPVADATEDSLTNAIVKNGGLPVTSTITSTNETGGNMFSVTGDKRLTPEQLEQIQEDSRAKDAVRGVINEFRRSGSEPASSVIERLGREQVRQMVKRDGGEAAVQIFDIQHPE
jgi:hypothetical protein